MNTNQFTGGTEPAVSSLRGILLNIKTTLWETLRETLAGARFLSWTVGPDFFHESEALIQWQRICRSFRSLHRSQERLP